MLNQSATDVDELWRALAEPTRRRILERLSTGPTSVTSLAAPLPMSLPAVVQHLQVLEACGLIGSEKAGRVRTCYLRTERLDLVQEWIAARRRHWERRLDRLGDVVEVERASQTIDTRNAKEEAR